MDSLHDPIWYIVDAIANFSRVVVESFFRGCRIDFWLFRTFRAKLCHRYWLSLLSPL